MQIEKNNLISTIEWLRGFSMLSICYTHYKIHFISNNFWFHTMMYADFGVSLFFVISGFVIPLSLYNKNYTIHDYPNFIYKRLLRVYPPFIGGLIITIFLALLSNYSPFHQGPSTFVTLNYIISNLLLVPTFFHQPWYSPVLWTLAIEVQFYLIFGLIAPLIFSEKKWVCFSMLFLFGLAQFVTKDERLFGFHSLVFLIGIIGFLKYVHKISFLEWLIFTILILVGIAFKMEITATKFLAIPLAIILILFVPLKNQFLEFCGKISYSYYILHIIIGGSLIIDFGKNFIHSPIGINILTFSTIFIMIPISWVFFQIFELPFQKLRGI